MRELNVKYLDIIMLYMTHYNNYPKTGVHNDKWKQKQAQ